jgi:hypothetical protein
MENQVFERQIFKVGDRVFDAAFGWGEVTSYKKDFLFPVGVNFDNGRLVCYTWDGKVTLDSNPTLSFTAYNLGGFSQEKQIKFPCTGMFEGKRFGICVEKDKNGYFRGEQGTYWSAFQPMTFEEYCKLKNIEL